MEKTAIQSRRGYSHKNGSASPLLLSQVGANRILGCHEAGQDPRSLMEARKLKEIIRKTFKKKDKNHKNKINITETQERKDKRRRTRPRPEGKPMTKGPLGESGKFSR